MAFAECMMGVTRIPSWILNTLGILLVCLLWQAAGAGLGDALLATPSQVLGTLLHDTLRDGTFWRGLGEMVWQMLIGYVLSVVIGIPLGIAMGRIHVVRAVVKPWAAMFVVTSAAALVPLFIVMLGRGLLMTTAIVFVVTVWYVVLTMSEAARSVSPKSIDVARAYGATRLQVFRYILLPALHPHTMIAMRIGLTHALRAMVTAEMFISTGFGKLLNDAGLDLTTAPLFALIVVLMVCSAAATRLLKALADWSAPWYAAARRKR
nr:ABC transporter permease subunit [Robbsia andropogonis]